MNPTLLSQNARALVLAGAFSAMALSAIAVTSEVGRREVRQQDRIANGINGGQLTPAEVTALEAREAALRSQIKDDRSVNGGRLTAAERKQVNAELDVVSDQIYRAKHNGRTMPPAKP